MAPNGCQPRTAGQVAPEAGVNQRAVMEDQANNTPPEGPIPPAMLACDICADQGEEQQPRLFKSKAGLGVHKAHAHRNVVDRQITNTVNQTRSVTEHDRIIIAEAEIKSESKVVNGRAGCGINQLILRELGTTRYNNDKIKNIRKSTQYQATLAQVREHGNVNRDDEPNPEDINVSGAEEHDHMDNGQNESGENIEDQRRNGFEEVFQSYNTEDLVGLTAARCMGAGAVEVRIATMKVLESVGCKMAAPEPKGRRTNSGPPRRPQGSRKAKARRFYRAQTLYSKSPGGAFKAVLQDTLETADSVPAGEKDKYWQDLFSKTAQYEPDANEPTTQRPVEPELAKPISRAEVKQILKSAKATSPGADKVDRKLLRKIGPDRLRVLFNLFLLTSIVPEELKMGRVTLIPKTDKPNHPKDFRPITVGSMILRSYHSLLCKRLQTIPLRGTQKGFMERDGISENISILKALFQKARTDRRSVYMCLLDVSKAFDSVAHGAIIAALERLGVPAELITYVRGLYSNAQVLVGEKYVSLGRGVRQGCPLSTFLFNAVIDMCLDGIPVQFGFKLDDDISLADLFFADDGVLVSDTDQGLQKLLDHITERFRRVGLELNAQKSHSLAFPYSGVRGRNYVNANSFLKVGDVTIPAMEAEDRTKYLGIYFGAKGFKPVEAISEFSKLAERVRRSPLTPCQKFHCVKSALIPKMLHQLVLSDCTNQILVSLDLELRKLMRNILKLPNDVSNAGIHGNTKVGGLGIPSFQVTVKRLHFVRLSKLEGSDCRFVRYFRRENLIVNPPVPKFMGRSIATKGLELDLWKELLKDSTDLCQLASDGFCNETRAWFTNPEFALLKNGDFIKAVHVRMKSLATPTRLRRRGKGDGTCAIDLTPNASLSHVSQMCGVTYGQRIKRHNDLMASLKRGLVAAGWKCQIEPRIPSGTTFQKPDIVARKGNSVVVLDPAITGDSVAYLRDVGAKKVAKYSNQEVRDYCNKLQETDGKIVSDFKVIGVPVTYRGDMLTSTSTELKSLGIRKGFISYLSFGVVLETWHVWRMYYSNSRAGGNTTRRWRRRLAAP